MTAAAVSWASTDAAGISSRGNQTFFTRSALAIRELVPSCTPAWKKPHTASPASTKSG